MSATESRSDGLKQEARQELPEWLGVATLEGMCWFTGTTVARKPGEQRTRVAWRRVAHGSRPSFWNGWSRKSTSHLLRKENHG